MQFEIIINIFKTALVVGFMLGLMIFVHELGHYLAARLAGMRVEAFAFGFGPSLFKRRRGPTVFTVNAIPVGGYCKVAGMELDDYDVPDGFNTKSAPARFMVIAAGVVMNLVLAFLLFFLFIAIWGDYRPQLTVSQIFPDAAILEQELDIGIGDTILAVDGKPVGDSYELFETLRRIPDGQPVDFEIARDDDSHIVTITPRPPKPVYRIGALLMGTVVLDVGKDTPAAQAGLKARDMILAVNGHDVRSRFDIIRLLSQDSSFFNLGRMPGLDTPWRVTLTIQRPDEPAPLMLTMAPVRITAADMASAELTMRRFGFLAETVPEQTLNVDMIMPGSTAEKTGFRDGDVLVAIDGAPIRHIIQAKDLLLRDLGRESRILVRRDGRLESFGYTPELDWSIVMLNFERDVSFELVRYHVGIPRSLVMGWNQLYGSVKYIWEFLGKLFHREVPVSVGGPVSVIRLAATYSRQGSMDQIIFFTASISIMLALFNLFPIPGLDGARLLVIVMEFIMSLFKFFLRTTRIFGEFAERIPTRVNPKVEYYVHMVGFLLLMGLFVIITYIDVMKWITGSSIF